MNVGNSYRWYILGMTWFSTFTFAIIYQSIPPILGMLIDALQISYAQAGSLMSLFTLPAIFLAIPGGLMADRYGSKVVGGVALTAMVLGTAIATQSSSYWVLGLGRLVAGTGSMVILMLVPKIITSWFRDQELGLSMGVQMTAMPMGTIIALRKENLTFTFFNSRKTKTTLTTPTAIPAQAIPE